MTKTKTFKRFSNAKRFANGRPIIRVNHDLFCVVDSDDPIHAKLTEVSLISGEGYITGHVSMGHLDRLGNANWATPSASANSKSRPHTFEPRKEAA